MLALAAALGPVAANAQNLLFNGDFPEVLGLNGWEEGSGASASWSTFERGFSAPWLGSARVAGNGGFLSQCVPAFAGAHYRLSGWVFLAQGTEAGLRMRFVMGTCENWLGIPGAVMPTAQTAVADDWTFLDVTSRAPPGSVGVRAELYTATSSGGGSFGHFDDIELPEPAGAVAALCALAGLCRSQPRRSRIARDPGRAHAPVP